MFRLTHVRALVVRGILCNLFLSGVLLSANWSVCYAKLSSSTLLAGVPDLLTPSGVPVVNKLRDKALGPQATLLLLRASVGVVDVALKYRIWPQRRISSESDVIEHLDRLSKPIQCTGSLSDDILEIRCEATDRVFPHERLFAAIERLEDVEVSRSIGEHPHILLKAGDQRLLMPVSSALAWLQSYHFENYGLALKLQDEEAGLVGAVASLLLVPPPKILAEEIY